MCARAVRAGEARGMAANRRRLPFASHGGDPCCSRARRHRRVPLPVRADGTTRCARRRGFRPRAFDVRLVHLLRGRERAAEVDGDLCQADARAQGQPQADGAHFRCNFCAAEGERAVAQGRAYCLALPHTRPWQLVRLLLRHAGRVADDDRRRAARSVPRAPLLHRTRCLMGRIVNCRIVGYRRLVCRTRARRPAGDAAWCDEGVALESPDGGCGAAMLVVCAGVFGTLVCPLLAAQTLGGDRPLRVPRHARERALDAPVRLADGLGGAARSRGQRRRQRRGRLRFA
mmetsp:Transcript_31769/g.79299  ORF Transcript_31769/g.79299 Transcript_31769/m.79299 type:complete len:287 (+) Transcript_31769:770-1630(+)